MVDGWLKIYEELQGFIKQHPEIEITEGSVCIPAEVRTDFYHLFDALNAEFVKEHFSRELTKATTLSDHWRELSGQVVQEMGLLSIDLPLHIKWFMADPLDGLTRSLFDPLFDLLKGRTDLRNFEEQAAVIIKRNFGNYYRNGYRCWVVIALVRELVPEALLEVKGQDIYNDVNLMDGTGGTGVMAGDVPGPEPATTISFIEAPVHAFLTPKIIVRSKKIGAFVSLRPDFHESSWNSRTYSERQQWLEIPEELQKHPKEWLWSDIVLHVAKDPADLSLVADYSHIARPAACIEVREGEEWYQKEGLDSIRRHADFLQPKRGTFVACLEGVPEGALSELRQSTEPELHAPTRAIVNDNDSMRVLHFLHVDYDPLRLEPVVEALSRET